ncbi:MAG: hypothetical protein JXA60_08880 [Candidatus Coatesbacteria bacterium]|nr:hypothetical protein [Candidatus Coatesbacteria bacterium]
MSSTQEVIKDMLGEISKIAKTETVVGDAIDLGNSKVVPISKIILGFGAGGGYRGDEGEGSGAGGGLVVQPMAFIVQQKDRIEILSTEDKSTLLNKIIDLVPAVMSQLPGFNSASTPSEDTKIEEDED